MKFLSCAFIFIIASTIAWAQTTQPLDPPAPPPVQKIIQPTDGIGALGYIDARSRVITLSHDAGPEGARIAQILVKTGDTVKAGDLIATLSDAPRKQAQLDIARAQIPVIESEIKVVSAELAFAKNEFRRSESLAQSSAGSVARKEKTEKDLKQAQANIQMLQARLDAAKAQEVLATEELAQSQVIAPIDGTIIDVHARAGERVGDKGIVDIADLTKLDVLTEVYERDIARVRVGQKAEVMVPGIADKIAGEVYEIGHIVRKNDLNDTDPLATRDRRVIQVRVALNDAAAPKLKNMLYMQVDVRLLATPQK